MRELFMRAESCWVLAFLVAAATATAQNKIAIPAEQESRVVILMRVDATGHHVERMSRAMLPANPPARAATKGAAVFRYTVSSSNGVALATGEVADPRTLRGPLPLPGEKARGHEVVSRPTGYYLIRVPDSAAMRYLRIESQGPAVPGVAKAAGAAQVIDLAGMDIR
jgi:hypothetical protein